MNTSIYDAFTRSAKQLYLCFNCKKDMSEMRSYKSILFQTHERTVTVNEKVYGVSIIYGLCEECMFPPDLEERVRVKLFVSNVTDGTQAT